MRFLLAFQAMAKDTLRVRNSAGASRIEYRGKLYTWPKSGVLELPADEARAVADAHLTLTLEGRPGLSHGAAPERNAETSAPGGGD